MGLARKRIETETPTSVPIAKEVEYRMVPNWIQASPATAWLTALYIGFTTERPFRAVYITVGRDLFNQYMSEIQQAQRWVINDADGRVQERILMFRTAKIYLRGEGWHTVCSENPPLPIVIAEPAQEEFWPEGE
jgi:hypothetical protein